MLEWDMIQSPGRRTQEFIELLRIVHLLKFINYMNKKKENIWILSANCQEKTSKYKQQVKPYVYQASFLCINKNKSKPIICIYTELHAQKETLSNKHDCLWQEVRTGQTGRGTLCCMYFYSFCLIQNHDLLPP